MKILKDQNDLVLTYNQLTMFWIENAGLMVVREWKISWYWWMDGRKKRRNRREREDTLEREGEVEISMLPLPPDEKHIKSS